MISPAICNIQRFQTLILTPDTKAIRKTMQASKIHRNMRKTSEMIKAELHYCPSVFTTGTLALLFYL